MRKWWLAAFIVGLLSAVAIASSRPAVQNFVRVFLASPLRGRVSDRSAIDRSVVAALTALATSSGNARVHILSHSADFDAAIMRAATGTTSARVTILPRDSAAIDRAAGEGELLTVQEGRRYLEMFGFELEWLPQPADVAAFPLLRVKRKLHCATVRGDRWSFLPGVEFTGRLGVRLPPGIDSQIMFVIGDAVPLDIEVLDVDGVPLVTRREVMRPGPASGTPPDFWLGDGNPWSAPGAVIRLTLDALPARERLASVGLGRRAPRVLARLRNYPDDARARVCAASLGVEDAFESTSTLLITPRTPEYFGTGWYGAEQGSKGVGEIRWMKKDAAVLVPSEKRGRIDVQLFGAPPPDVAEGGLPPITLTVNDVFAAVASAPASRGGSRTAPTYRWTIPVSAWVSGTNELLFSVARSSRASANDAREIGFALKSLRLEISDER